MPRVLWVRLVCVAAAAWLLFTSAYGADRPAHYCLPEETLFVVRVPAAAAFLEAIKTRTKLGAVVTAEQRLADLQKLFHAEAAEDLDAFAAGLDRLGLTTADLQQALDGELGYAGLLLPDAAGYAGLAWSDGEPDLIDKWFVALERKLQDQPEGKRAIRREDLELAGTKVVHLTVPLVVQDESKLSVGFNSKTGLKIETGDKEKDAEKAKEDEKSLQEIGQVHLLLARGRNRLTLAHAVTDNAAVKESGLDVKAVEAAEATVENLRELMAKFLAASRGSDEGIVRVWEQTPGMAETLPDGEPLAEAYVNLPRLVQLLNVPTNEDVWKFAQAAGVEKLGVVGYRMALDGTVLRSGLFAAIPAPRSGLLTLLDQAPLKPQPADWVAKTATGYQHISFDLGKAYQRVTQVMRESYPRGDGMIHALENQSQAFFQTDPTTILTSLGKTHTMLTYLPVLNDEEDKRRANRENAAEQTAMAFVWLPSDDGVWRKLMQLLGAAAAQPIVTEQGFTGMRYQQEQLHGAWFIGNGYMILAIGKGVTEKVLANLRSTPRTDESLRGTPYALRAAELLPATTTLSYDLTDGAGMVRFADTVMQRAFADVSDASAAKLKQLWPTAQEWEGTIGVSASAISVDGNGVTYRSVLDLPAP